MLINKELSNLKTSEQFKTWKEKNLHMLLVRKPRFYNKTASEWLTLLYYFKGVCEIYM